MSYKFKGNEIVKCETLEEWNAIIRLAKTQGYLENFSEGRYDFIFDIYIDSLKICRYGTYDNLDNYKSAYPDKIFINAKTILKNTSIKSIDSEGFKKIYNVACSSWKDILTSKFAKDLIFEESVEISDTFYKKMRDASNVDQNKVLDEVFGKDVVEETYSIGDRFLNTEKVDLGEYILARVGDNLISLIKLSNGNIYKDSVKVKDTKKITEDELIKIGLGNFKLKK